MLLRRLTSLGLLAAVVAATAGCIVVPAPYPRRVYAPPPPPVVYAPPPPPACRWVWVHNHWECR
jgi:hypothetical protein